LGLFLYDHLGGRRILPATKVLDLRFHQAGKVLKDGFTTGFEYSDCWVQDSRLVSLNARDAADRGAKILTRSRVTGAQRRADHWEVSVEDTETGELSKLCARTLINAAGPWVGQVLNDTLATKSKESVRLVRGSHIVTRRLFEHDQPYILQGADGRVVFVIPYERDFTLIGTTDMDHDGPPGTAHCSDEEAEYLCAFVSDYLRETVTQGDIVWRFSGVRPLYADGASSATEATRDYVLSLEQDGGARLLNVFGGKITTYRRLAEAALAKLGYKGEWTAGVALPGGDFPVDGVNELIAALKSTFPFLSEDHALRLVTTYGTEASQVLGNAKTPANLGQDFGAGLFETEVRWLMKREFAMTAEDILWRRTKLGLVLDDTEVRKLEEWIIKEQKDIS
jgi:glycerol-3-phosphate dehydrogenase